jgi:hypothetical protein
MFSDYILNEVILPIIGLLTVGICVVSILYRGGL